MSFERGASKEELRKRGFKRGAGGDLPAGLARRAGIPSAEPAQSISSCGPCTPRGNSYQAAAIKTHHAGSGPCAPRGNSASKIKIYFSPFRMEINFSLQQKNIIQNQEIVVDISTVRW